MAKKPPTKAKANVTEPTVDYLSLQETTEVLVKHFGYHAGLYALSVEFKIAIGQVGPSPNELLPGTMVGVSRIGLLKADKLGPHVVDASEVNPSPPKV